MSDLRRSLIDWLEFYRQIGVISLDRMAAEKLVQMTAGIHRPEARATETLEAIRADLGDCTRCKLHSGRTHIVFGSGNPRAALMFIGEGPGADEDSQGLPFVGKAGQLLTRIIESIQLRRDEVYIANVVKCRPPGNRNPEPDEIGYCSPFLLRQIESVNPRIICTLGKFSAQTVLQTALPITQLRGKPVQWRGRIVVPTFHPSYLLRNPAAKREVWEDMKLIRSLLQQVGCWWLVAGYWLSCLADRVSS